MKQLKIKTKVYLKERGQERKKGILYTYFMLVALTFIIAFNLHNHIEEGNFHSLVKTESQI